METYDYVIIGSGFGGSISAMRLAQKGYKVAVLEMGKRYRPEDLPESNWNLKKYFWLPLLRCFGIQRITLLKKVMVLHGTGVGGGSLVYAAILLKPNIEVFQDSAWPSSLDWQQELAPYYESAKKMLGVDKNPKFFETDHVLMKLSQELGVENTFHSVDAGIYFGDPKAKPGKIDLDPYFQGDGPARTPCRHCGACIIGCRYGSKNSLDMNYLYFAEAFGAEVFPETKAYKITPEPKNMGYLIDTIKSTSWFQQKGPTFKARKVIVASGVLGTVDLLLKNRDIFKTLPNVSQRLGEMVRTNGESLVGATSFDENLDLSQGLAIGSKIQVNQEVSIEPVRYPRGSGVMRLLAVPLTGKGSKITRPLKLLGNSILKLPTTLRLLSVVDWAKSTIILLVMQSTDNKMKLSLKRSKLVGLTGDKPIPSYIELGQEAAKLIAKEIKGTPQNIISEVLLDTPATAHILGGACMGDNPSLGVIDTNHEVFGHPGLYICDGSSVPVNLGVNPSLTISALAERFCANIPANSEQKTRRCMKDFGWGDPKVNFNITSSVETYIENKFNIHIKTVAPQKNIKDVRIKNSEFPTTIAAQFSDLLGSSGFSVSQEDLVRFSQGKSYRDLIHMQSLKLEQIPDAVLYPKNEEHIKGIFQICQEHQIAIVPYSGGTSVVGGLDAYRGDKNLLVALDLTGLNRILELDAVSQTIRVEAGVYGVELEKHLNKKGYTLGHFPQSFEYTTVGGWVAARSSGQNSILYGSIDQMVLSLKVITPKGTIQTAKAPNMACGPDMKQILIGSEGVFGVITSCILRVSHLPAQKYYCAYMFKNFEDATKASRQIAQSEAKPAMIRVSDVGETEALLAFSSSPKAGFKKWFQNIAKRFFKSQGYDIPHVSMMMVGLEGSVDEIKYNKKVIQKILKATEHKSLGQKPGTKWLKDRFYLPYARDAFLDQGLLVDTFETATTWNNVDNIYASVKDALDALCKQQDSKWVLYCHLSHLYTTGASLYFTIICKQKEDLIAQYEAIKNKASEVIIKNNGVISHHHGIGKEHKAFLNVGECEVSILKAIKKTLDPEGILNPGKMIPEVL